ncbi:helix-turn-helix domain-containing protein [Sulfolobus acidocaldarius]|uniref:Uncharacterized protein n=4 Tax=Sulfolobus acidocaldarius TaxID=2285 RepID=Q4J7C2_SULAC|nr:helix-turn-helix domain-containing protein [Sulfolobus acidocaldarius]AAY81304.1 hypothetical protein Saci_2005 [Sulfolobus acidocaldarius DSM 639]AGE71944.1 hypothetical protein SacN8_09950 [Sulfolobus acidocaldarius N8]AGE74216.1 hypothetical protein SacRon12I_09970 [Sulfolobus acidocaldarius Ron12/I]ALU29892.1 hypothetical protein ATY89_08045 [Sulfolobus acidocaldarius]ALU32633.1 hypothetical protein ATZ20_11065 [Sulfolobus acidocaldarius]
MTFGESFGKFLTKTDCVKIVNILRDEYNVNISEIAKKIGITRSAIYHWIWEIAKYIDEENKAKLLDLLYEKDRVRAISFVQELLVEYMGFLEKEKRKILKTTPELETRIIYTNPNVTISPQEGVRRYAIKVL